jgi:hypothetical protein
MGDGSTSSSLLPSRLVQLDRYHSYFQRNRRSPDSPSDFNREFHTQQKSCYWLFECVSCQETSELGHMMWNRIMRSELRPGPRGPAKEISLDFIHEVQKTQYGLQCEWSMNQVEQHYRCAQYVSLESGYIERLAQHKRHYMLVYLLLDLVNLPTPSFPIYFDSFLRRSPVAPMTDSCLHIDKFWIAPSPPTTRASSTSWLFQLFRLISPFFSRSREF